MKLPIPKRPSCLTFLRFCSSFNSTTYLNENERYTINTNLFININNNTASFVPITWHQKEILGCVVYSHCPINDSYNKCIHSCCLPCNYVTKPFGILQRVIKSQKVCISFEHSKRRYLLWLNFQICFEIFRSNEMVLSKKFRPCQCAVFK